MKTTDLMVGDWVNYDPNVFNDDEYLPREPSKRITVGRGEDIDLAEENCYSPIPFNEKILKTNGFVFKSDSCMHYNHCIDVYLNKDGDIFMLIGGHQRWIKYVHELQHALRLCGLNELADNFKINV